MSLKRRLGRRPPGARVAGESRSKNGRPHLEVLRATFGAGAAVVRAHAATLAAARGPALEQLLRTHLFCVASLGSVVFGWQSPAAAHPLLAEMWAAHERARKENEG